MNKLKTKISYTLYTLLALVFFTSCNHLNEGEVVGRHYEPTREDLIMMPMTISTGKSFTTIMIPYYVTDYEDFVLHIKGNHKGEEVVEKVYVSESCYNRLKNGDRWEKGDECSFSDDNNKKVRKD